MPFEYARVIFANILVAVAAFGIGAPLARFLPQTIPPWTRRICCWIAGFGILGVVLFVIGQWKLTRFTIGIVLDIGVIAAGITALREHWFPLHWRPRISKSQLIPAAVIAAVMLITAVNGLAEPVGDSGADGVAYHLLGPKVWLRDGIVRPVPDNANTAYPATTEMTFSALMEFGGQRAPGFSSVLTLAFLLMISAALAVRCGASARGSWWAAALVATMPSIYQGAHSGFVDAIYATYVLAAALVAFDAETGAHFAIVGVFCGLAIATKYTGLIAIPALLIIAAWPRKSASIAPRGGFLRGIVIAALAASAVAMPFYLRNWILLGSPIFPPPPGVARFMHIKYLSVDALRAYYDACIERGKGHGRGLIAFLLLPFGLTFHAADFNGGGGIGLAPLALAPLGIAASWNQPVPRRLAIFGAFLTIAWFATMQESRYLIHACVIGAIFAVLGWSFAEFFIGRRGAALGAIVVTISLVYGLIEIVAATRSNMRSVVSASYAAHRRSAEIPFVSSFDYLNHNPDVTRVLILDPSITPYYSDKDYLKPFGQWGERVLPDTKTPSDALAKLGELQVSHILDVHSNISSFQVPPNFPGLVLVFERPDQRVYAVNRPRD
jgi:drug/metabolite transporter superfamily protein YnfA